jgi:hypothetical protein
MLEQITDKMVSKKPLRQSWLGESFLWFGALHNRERRNSIIENVHLQKRSACGSVYNCRAFCTFYTTHARTSNISKRSFNDIESF